MSTIDRVGSLPTLTTSSGSAVPSVAERYGSSPMPSEMGHVVVPDVQPGNRAMGEAMIYDCLFDDCPRLIAQDDQFGLAAQKEYAAHIAKKGKPHERD